MFYESLTKCINIFVLLSMILKKYKLVYYKKDDDTEEIFLVFKRSAMNILIFSQII